MGRVLVSVVLCVMLVSCKATIPLSEQTRPELEKARSKVAWECRQFQKALDGSERRDVECESKRYKEIDAALYKREIAEAPACLDSFEAPERLVDKRQLKNSARPVAELVARGDIISPILRTSCTNDVCAWLREYHPNEFIPYCEGQLPARVVSKPEDAGQR